MKHIVCSIFDSATEAYMRPFTAQSKGQALRMFTDLVNQENHDLNMHPEDFSLFQVGTFDDNSAELTSNVVCIARAHEIKAIEEK